ncbi:DsbA family protein [Magnetovibrio sp.]|uniref:DsbA family protein n=1 Tax=Magnetovibrio sp. TaxID=2024836 RepID=UPI002F93AD05
MSFVRTFIIATAMAIGAPLGAAHADTLSAAQKTEVEQVVRAYLLKNPEVIVEAINELQRRDEAAAAEKQRIAMQAMSADLTASPNDPVMGNPNGDVTMVEFFDYRCGFCKRVFDDVQTLIKEDGNIRYVLKEFPILGDDSVYASRAALAVWLHQRDKYPALHTALMTSKGALSNDKVMELAKDAGIDTQALAEQMNDPEIGKTVNATHAQAQALGITGTPAFIIGDNIAPGAIPLASMKKMVDAARGKATN